MQVDRWLYINLQHRTDRRLKLEKQLSKLDVLGKAERIDAIKNENGHLGCTQSHIKALEYAYSHPLWSWVAILEDDFDWRDVERTKVELQRVFERPDAFDVYMLGFSCPDGPPTWDELTGLHRVTGARTTSGYIIRREFIPVLLHIFQRGECAMRYGGRPVEFTVDQIWVPLQQRSRFYTSVPSLGFQRPDFSDIEQCHYNYRGC